MLLFMVEADFDQWLERFERRFIGLTEEFCDRRIHMLPIGGNFIGARSS